MRVGFDAIVMPALLRNIFYMPQWISGLAPITQLAQASAADFDAATMGPVLAAIIGFVIIMVLVVMVLVALIIIAKWHIFKKVGQPGWTALVPFYNTVQELEYTNLPMWWVFLIIIPFVNIIFTIILARRIAGVFGKGAWFTVGLVVLPFIFYPILGFGSSTYSNTYPPAKPMSEATKYALIAAFAFMLLFMRGGSPSSHTPRPLQPLSSGYAMDSSYVYYYDEILPNAEPLDFKVSDEYGYDRHAVYYAGDPVTDVDAESFAVVGGEWAKDNAHVYDGGDVVPGADPATFSFFAGDEQNYYVYDAAHVFTYNGIVKDADPQTFKVLDYAYGVDAKNVYYDGKVIAGADVATFMLVDDPSGDYRYEAKDKNHYYYSGKVVSTPK